MTQSCPNISLTQFKKPIRDCYLMMHDVGGNLTAFRLSLSFLYLEKTTEHDFSTDILIIHLMSHCSSSLIVDIRVDIFWTQNVRKTNGTDRGPMQGLEEAKLPSNAKDLRSLLGIVQVSSHFIKHTRKITEPL
ncbi:hypothetical protein BpHYR1_012209 [Brachionus plicatilis]|uniref:Uncharacterized protein n=1 Tax=Brachionus plicatilis TaxID=10195 RepID=A0A3M7REP5_BRAPC|nr:hypothetical protein BpHYR1_012209 [Brachionus plicatilis]